MEIQKGTTIGNYVVHDSIGSGGYGTVWKATDTQLKRDVALKRLLKTGFSPSSQQVNALLDEARKGAQLRHANIVQVYVTITHGDDPILVMEYVDGPSLWKDLREKASLHQVTPLDEAMSILKDVLSGLSYAHSMGICHRDLSPGNILLTSSRIPKIADFGLARTLTIGEHITETVASQSQGGTGNPDFMSPEQARGEPADFSSDLFMVGIIGYMLLSGVHPFANPSGLFSIKELLLDPDYVPASPRAPSNLPPSQQRVFKEYAAIVMKLLRREKAARYSAAHEALTALEDVTPSIDCPVCGERLPEQARFCSSCGAELQSQSSTGAKIAVRPGMNATADELDQYGYWLSRNQRWEEAITFYRNAVEKDTNFSRAYWNLAFALNHVGSYDDAISMASAGLSLPGGNAKHSANLYSVRSFAHAKRRNYTEALQDITEALKSRPDSTEYLYARGRIHRYLGNKPEARRDAEEVLKRQPDHTGALRLLSEMKES